MCFELQTQRKIMQLEDSVVGTSLHLNQCLKRFQSTKGAIQPKCPSTEEWIKKMWYIYTLEYYSAIKRNENCAICRDVHRPRDSYRVKSEKQISYNIAYMWNLEKRYRWIYLQSRNRDTDIENGRMDTRWGGGKGWIGRLGLTYIYYWYYV